MRKWLKRIEVIMPVCITSVGTLYASTLSTILVAIGLTWLWLAVRGQWNKIDDLAAQLAVLQASRQSSGPDA